MYENRPKKFWSYQLQIFFKIWAQNFNVFFKKYALFQLFQFLRSNFEKKIEVGNFKIFLVITFLLENTQKNFGVDILKIHIALKISACVGNQPLRSVLSLIYTECIDFYFFDNFYPKMFSTYRKEHISWKVWRKNMKNSTKKSINQTCKFLPRFCPKSGGGKKKCSKSYLNRFKPLLWECGKQNFIKSAKIVAW